MQACSNIEAEIFVIDNLSTDGSNEYFTGKFKGVTFLWNTENVGFSRANNQALKLATGNFVLFLNPDTILPEDCLRKCLTCFQKEDVGSVGIRMIDGSGNFLKESKRGFPSPFTSLCKLSGLTALFPTSKIFARYYLGHLDQHTSQEADVLSGAFMMTRKSLLDNIGGFDERFFMYGEDIDLSFRIQKAGYKNLYFAETTMIHFKGESTQKHSREYTQLFYGAMSLFVKKHYGRHFARVYNFLIQITISIKIFFSGVRNLVSLSFRQTRETIKHDKFLIFGDKKMFAYVQSILQRNNIKSLIYDHGTSNDLTTDNPINIENLSFFLNNQSVKYIIFCINDFSAKETIALMERLPKKINLMFHFAGTNCIAGSNHKDSSGNVIA